MNEFVFIFLLIPFILIVLGMLIWSLIWVHRDAELRGKQGWLVVLLVLFLDWPISLVVWMVFRPEVKKS